ncbi:MAG: XRE family transcriptional regulator [Clostridiales Family XIII bacterium]|jgi:transcriptional regulator with XRE-family HTH domain|nr:XRE family transcriptional regulator [Clostridiales Family XIII bacterium]
MKSLESLCYAIKQARKDKKLTQKQLAEKAMVSRAWIIALEKGQARGAEIGKIMDVISALDYDIDIYPSRPLSDDEKFIMERVFNA